MQILKKHNNNLYNTLLNLSRNIFFYKRFYYQTHLKHDFLMFFHFSIIMIVFKLKGTKFDQNL